MHLAAYRRGSAPMIALLLQAGADVDGRNASYQTPLAFAVVSCDVEAIRLLLNARADRSAIRDDELTRAIARQRCAVEWDSMAKLLAR